MTEFLIFYWLGNEVLKKTNRKRLKIKELLNTGENLQLMTIWGLKNTKESTFVFLLTGEKFDQMNYELEVSRTIVIKSSPQSNEKSG